MSGNDFRGEGTLTYANERLELSVRLPKGKSGFRPPEGHSPGSEFRKVRSAHSADEEIARFEDVKVALAEQIGLLIAKASAKDRPLITRLRGRVEKADYFDANEKFRAVGDFLQILRPIGIKSICIGRDGVTAWSIEAGAAQAIRRAAMNSGLNRVSSELSTY